MGLDRVVTFPPGRVPGWAAVKEQLARVGESAPLRMIEGLPAFPDEVPADGWTELRVSAGGGMVTVRRAGHALVCVVWSNADPALLAARDKVAWACAEAGGGQVVTDAGSLSPADFARTSHIQPA
ncbi:MAG: hypothetical protein K2V38_01170 [Gemmataceae bacterium]|nr:hypothetical protein [Gemmataceae bacterium]